MTPVIDSKKTNAPGGNVVRSSSSFDLSYKVADTYQYGMIKPCFISEVVPRDKSFRLHSKTEMRSMNLKAPLMQNINMYKAHFCVPMEAILPLSLIHI